MSNVIGIDPGKTGAVAVLGNGSGDVMVHDMPGDERAMAQLYADLAHLDVSALFIEKVGAMPKQGVSSTFKFGQSYGMCRMWAAMFAAPVIYVTPQKWQKVLDSDTGKDKKERSLLYARRRWPKAELHLKKHHGRADALCIAEWGARNYGHGC